MKTLLSFLLTINLISASLAQGFKPYQWQEKRERYALSEAEKANSLLVLKSHIAYQLVYEGERRDLIQYLTRHEIRRVNNDDAIERSNRIYIPMNNTLDIVEIKARVINASGKVTELDANNIKELEDEEAGSGYKIFAMEGVEVDSEIEYYYTKKMEVNYFGREYFQYSYPQKEVSFTLSCPENLEFDFRSYNGLAEIAQTDESEEFNLYELKDADLESLPEEGFAVWNANRKRLEFKLAYNASQGSGRLFTWGAAANRIQQLIYPIGKEEKKAVAKWIKKQKPNAKASLPEQVKFLEHQVKTTLYIEEKAGAEASDLTFLLANNYGNERGFTRLFVAILEELQFPFEIVLTDSRQSVKFDPDFDTWNYLNDYLLYLPTDKAFLAPYHFEYRYGTIPAELTATHGLFIKSAKVQDFEVPVATTQFIPAPDYRKNFDNLYISVDFNKDLSANDVSVKRSFRGYQASFMKAAYPVIDDSRKKELLESIIKYLAEDAEIKETKLLDTSFDFNKWEEPFTIASSYSTPSYLDLAGDVILFKAGELIGQQSELYQEDERVSAVENDHNRGYERKITINLPKGYLVENPDDLKMNVKAKEGEKVVYKFFSDYKLEGNTLSISLDEYYDQIYFPLNRFEEFRKVINAAADWNKITLVLKKK